MRSRSSAALLVLRLLDLATPVSTYALNIVIGIGLGLGIDYSLLLVSRYREELARHGPGLEAVRRTMATAGRTVAFSAVTVAAAIATLAMFPLGFLRSMGIAGGLVAPLAGLIALTVLPALFILLGERVNALSPRRWRRARRADGARRARRLVPVRACADAPPRACRDRGVGAAPRARAAVPVDPVHGCRPVRAAREGLVAGRLQRAPARLSDSGHDADLRRRPRHGDGRRGVAARVPAPLVAPPRELGAGVWEVQASSGKPFLDGASQRLVRQMRALPGRALVGGGTAQFLDQKHTLGETLPIAVALLCAVTFVLLWAATRSLRAAVQGAR